MIVAPSTHLDVEPAASRWPAHASRVGALEALVHIYEPHLTMVSTPLDVSPTDRQALSSLVASVAPFEFAKETSPAGEALEFALPWMDGEPGAAIWLEHARRLVALFSDLFEADRVGARLTLAQRPMCPRFHVDRVVCRLVVTFAGAASEFLGEDDVRRGQLGVSGAPGEHAGATVHQLEPLEVGLFKGEAWPGNEGRGLVHRSPPGNGPHLVMTLDLL